MSYNSDSSSKSDNRPLRGCLNFNHKTYAVYEGYNSVGRNPSAEINIKNVNISHYHAMITVLKDDSQYIGDLKSANGTYLNGKLLTPSKLYELKNGDSIKFADVYCTYKVTESEHILLNANTQMTQDLSQTFYQGTTQQIVNCDDSEVTEANSDVMKHELPTQMLNIHEMPTQMDIHEMETQVVEDINPGELYPPITEAATSSPVKENVEIPSQLSPVLGSARSVCSDFINSENNTSLNGTDSNDSIDFITGCKVSEKRSESPIEPTNTVDVGPSNTLKSDSEEILSPPFSQIRPLRISSKRILDSDSDTENEPTSNNNEAGSSEKRLSRYVLSSDSETDIEENDKSLDENSIIPETQTSIVKPQFSNPVSHDNSVRDSFKLELTGYSTETEEYLSKTAGTVSDFNVSSKEQEENEKSTNQPSGIQNNLSSESVLPNLNMSLGSRKFSDHSLQSTQTVNSEMTANSSETNINALSHVHTMKKTEELPESSIEVTAVPNRNLGDPQLEEIPLTQPNDEIYLQATQHMKSAERESNDEDASTEEFDVKKYQDELYMMPTQEISTNPLELNNLNRVVSSKEANTSSKENFMDDDSFLQPTQLPLRASTSKSPRLQEVLIRKTAESVEDELQMIFASQTETFTATQQLIEVLEDSRIGDELELSDDDIIEKSLTERPSLRANNWTMGSSILTSQRNTTVDNEKSKNENFGLSDIIKSDSGIQEMKTCGNISDKVNDSIPLVENNNLNETDSKKQKAEMNFGENRTQEAQDDSLEDSQVKSGGTISKPKPNLKSNTIKGNITEHEGDAEVSTAKSGNSEVKNESDEVKKPEIKTNSKSKGSKKLDTVTSKQEDDVKSVARKSDGSKTKIEEISRNTRGGKLRQAALLTPKCEENSLEQDVNKTIGNVVNKDQLKSVSTKTKTEETSTSRRGSKRQVNTKAKLSERLADKEETANIENKSNIGNSSRRVKKCVELVDSTNSDCDFEDKKEIPEHIKRNSKRKLQVNTSDSQEKKVKVEKDELKKSKNDLSFDKAGPSTKPIRKRILRNTNFNEIGLIDDDVVEISNTSIKSTLKTSIRKAANSIFIDDIKVSVPKNLKPITINETIPEGRSTRNVKRGAKIVPINEENEGTNSARSARKNTKRRSPVQEHEIVSTSPATIEEPTAKSRRLSANSRKLKKERAEEKHRTPSEDSVSSQNSLMMSPSGRSRRKLKPKVVFTMMNDPGLESSIRQLGGSVVDTVSACTVLVTESVKRSQKLLCAVGQAKPICSPEWLKASKKAFSFLDPWDYILIDEEAEKKWDFSLRESLNRSSQSKLFENYTFIIMVTQAVDVIKGAIEACGGKCVKNFGRSAAGDLVVVATEQHESKYSKLVKHNGSVKVVAAEAIFDATLRQEIRFENHLLI